MPRNTNPSAQHAIGATLSQIALSIHLGLPPSTVRFKGATVEHRGETWTANYYNGGRIQFYELTARRATTEGAPSAAALREKKADGAPAGVG